MARKYWLPHGLPQQAMLISNFRTKIGEYGAPLGLSPAEVAAAVALCDSFLAACNLTEQCRATMMAMTAWRDRILFGKPDLAPAPPPPAFPVPAPASYSQGVIKQFMLLRDRVLAAPGYTAAIGEDLGVIGPEKLRPAPGSITPELKAEVSTGFRVTLSGSMQGMDALRVEYSRDGSAFRTVAFLTTTPGGFQITPENPNQPEKGFLRAVYINKNDQVGNFSAIYPVTLV